MGNRNAVRLFEEPRLPAGRNARDRAGTIEEADCLVGAGVLLGALGRRMVEPTESTQNQEAWATGQKYFSIRFESFEAHFMQSLGSLPTDCFSTSYSTFVMYLVSFLNFYLLAENF